MVKKEKNKFDDLIENHKNKDEFDLKSKKIYLITDYRLDFDILVEKVRIALECGIKIVQYRAKEKSTKDMCAEARVLKQLCHEYNAIFIVNDRVDIALVVDAHGVHLGREDMKISEAKKILGEGKIIGATAHNEKEALEAISEGATYLGVGALYKSKSKSNTVNLSIETLQKIRKITDNPIFGIGGITENNINSSLRENIDGVAVISAIFQTNNIKNTIKEINENLK
ncbi:MAG: thiamine phosphate synthase [Sarcina ventriculi]|uniref:thiamine phosphate synthase n=1 Tax=Sarcina ventriculi TaxID=1267 RepID=UPI001F4460CA|nr:thiamine phosphate synthase [Sarcina ventriculi]MCI5637301.1 thiamine phosphate synthase [Sarcina ventriculi]MDD7372854.1 thiamine phosphate synthase [Sarcina ventriculi]